MSTSSSDYRAVSYWDGDTRIVFAFKRDAENEAMTDDELVGRHIIWRRAHEQQGGTE
jgi:hypothetical protein